MHLLSVVSSNFASIASCYNHIKLCEIHNDSTFIILYLCKVSTAVSQLLNIGEKVPIYFSEKIVNNCVATVAAVQP